MTDYYISAVKMDSEGQHIEEVKVRRNKGDKIGREIVTSRAFVADLIEANKLEFKTITKNTANNNWSPGAKVELTSDGFITTDPNNTKRDNLGSLPKFS